MGMADYAARQVDNALTEGEHVAYASKRHPISLLSSAIASIVIGIASLAGWFYANAYPDKVCAVVNKAHEATCATGLASVSYLLPIMGLGLGFMIIGVAYLNWSTRLLVLTEKRILMTSMYGFRVNDLPLFSMRDAQLQQPMLGLLFEYATIYIKTGDGPMRLNKVRNAKDFYRILSSVAFPSMNGAGSTMAIRQP
jgi:hypothetical protein